MRGRQADVNRPLGLTVYCWRIRLDQSARESKRHASTVQSCPASASTSLVAVVAMGLGGCTAMSKLSTSPARSGRARTPSPPPIPRAPSKLYGERYRANPKDADAALAYGQALRANGQRAQAAARARAGDHRQSRQQGVARPIRPCARRQWQFPAGLRRACESAFARQSGLAPALGAGHRARPDGPSRRGALLLCERAEDRAGRSRRALQSRPVLHAVEGPAEGRRGAAAGLRLAACERPGAAEISASSSAFRGALRKPRPS